MIALLQRVSFAKVVVQDNVVGAIDKGILIFLAIEPTDTETIAERLLGRILTYRIFPDVHGRMNLDVQTIHGGTLWVPQFTLAADTRKGTRPSFSKAAEPHLGQKLFDYVVCLAKKRDVFVETGQFGAHMKVELCNDGPVTFLLKC